MLLCLKRLAIVGILGGAGTGFFWSTLVTALSSDKLFSGTEMMISLTAPGIVCLLVWRIARIRLWIVVMICYLTLLIPLAGVGIGGSNVIQLTIAGAAGGFFWAIPIILSYFMRALLRGHDEASLRKAGRTH